MDYRTWLRQQTDRQDPIGDLARDAKQDKTWNGTQREMAERTLATDAEDAFEQSVAEFRIAKGSYKRRTAKGPYTLEHDDWTKTFRTKTDLITFYRALKDKGQTEGLDDTERKAVFALLTNHPERIITGQEDLQVGVHPIDRSICYKVDGCPISYNLCIATLGTGFDWGRPPLKYRKFFAAARCEIRDQVQVIDKANPGDHIDHVTFFCHLLHDWLTESNNHISQITCHGDSFALRFDDREIAQDWKDYHAKYAILRSIAPKINLKRKPAMMNWESVL